MEKKKRGDQLRAVAAVPAIQKTWCSCNRPYSSHLDARKPKPKTPWPRCESALLNERSCRLNSLSKRHVVIRPRQPFQGNSGQL